MKSMINLKSLIRLLIIYFRYAKEFLKRRVNNLVNYLIEMEEP